MFQIRKISTRKGSRTPDERGGEGDQFEKTTKNDDVACPRTGYGPASRDE